MINKQNLWFLTLFSLILVLSVYYITMPNDLLSANKKTQVTTSNKSKENTKNTVEELSSLVAMRVSLEEERQNEMDTLQEQLTSDSISGEEMKFKEKKSHMKNK